MSNRFINKQKKNDIEFVGAKLAHSGFYVQLFVFLYTLIPLPSTPLFTAAGVARIKPLHYVPAFFLGKFISDMAMVLISNYTVANSLLIAEGILSWESIFGAVVGIAMIICFLCIDWRVLLQQKKLRLSYKIWK